MKKQNLNLKIKVIKNNIIIIKLHLNNYNNNAYL